MQCVVAFQAKNNNQTGMSKSALFLLFELFEAEYLTNLEKDNNARQKQEAIEVKNEESAAEQAAKKKWIVWSHTEGKWNHKLNPVKKCLMLFCPTHGDVYQSHVLLI